MTGGLELTPITPNIGMRATGFDARAVGAGDAQRLREALRRHKVLVMPQQTLTSREYVDIMRVFGEPAVDDLQPHGDHPPELAILHIRPSEKQVINFWHMDYSFRERPAPVLSLYSRKVPPCGGDTLFTNLEAAYDGLPEATRARIEGLEANHKVTETQNSARRFTPEEFRAMVQGPPVRHPLVARNPDTGRRYLFVNVPIYCRSIAGMDNAEGDALLAELYAHAARPEFHFRHTWAVDTLVVWENVHCLHYPVSDYFPHERIMWRVVTKATRRPSA